MQNYNVMPNFPHIMKCFFLKLKTFLSSKLYLLHIKSLKLNQILVND